MEKIKLIYILGPDHSGSTILDLVLGSHSKVVSTGEVWAFNKWIHEGRICSCGTDLRDCYYWRNVILNSNCYQKLGKSMNCDYPELNRYTKFLSLFKNNARTLFNKTDVESYGKREYDLFGAIMKVSGKQLVVDSSKYLERLIKLFYSGYFDVKIIHLVRNGQAYLDSLYRAVERVEATRVRSVSTIREVPIWVLRMERQIRFLKSISEEHWVRINYKDLTQNPYETIESLCGFLGINYEKQVLDVKSDQYVFAQKHHIIGGNRVKRCSTNILIKYKENWKNNLPIITKLAFIMLGGEWMNKRLEVK